PDACTLCHSDRSLEWAVRATGGEIPLVPSGPEMPHVQAQALGGDPILRAVACAALGRTDALRSEGERARRLGVLLDVMVRDPYPAVRRIAWRSARALAGELDWSGYDPTAERSI